MAKSLNVFEPAVLTVEQTAAILGISRGSAYSAVKRGDIPHITVGKRVIVPRAALEKLLESAGSNESERN